MMQVAGSLRTDVSPRAIGIMTEIQRSLTVLLVTAVAVAGVSLTIAVT